MRKVLALTVSLGVVVTLVFAGLAVAGGGEGPITVKSGTLEFTADGGFSPKALSRKTPTPIALTAAAKIRETDGSHPPALKELLLETDKNGTVDVKGYPTCRLGQLQSTDTSAAERACGRALIGKGQTSVQVAFPEQTPIPVHSKLLVFNGGFKGGVTTLYVHAYFNAPITGAIVTTVKIKKHRHGRFGLLSTATIPKIAGGSGSVTSFNLTINKKFTYKHQKHSVLSATCTDGKLAVNAQAKFADGTSTQAEIIRSCTPKG